MLGGETARADTASRQSYLVDFSDHAAGSVEEWLKTKGFVPEKDARRRDRFGLSADEHGLAIQAERRLFGVLTNERVDVPVVSGIEIVWGVTRYPKGASYERGVNNEAIMIYVFLGDERLPSGSFLIPDSPYFIALYLCRDDRLNHPYVGNYFKKSGRFVCLDQPKPGETTVSRFDLLSAYRAYFDKEGDDDPAVSGMAISVDTSKSGDGGKAGAFIKRVRFSVFH